MHSFILQDWTTVRGGVSTMNQAESAWLDLSDYQDVIFWLEIKESSGTPTMAFQTSPTKDEALFSSMVSGQAMTAGQVFVLKVLMASAPTPLARYVRWALTGTVTWDATFRVWVSANAPGA